MLEILERLKDGAQTAGAQPAVELFGKGQEVDVGRVHPSVATARVWVRGSTAEAKADDPVMAMTGFDNQYKRLF